MRLFINLKQKFHLLLMLFLMSSCEKLPSANPPAYLRVMFQNDPATSFIIGWNRFESNKDDDIVFYDTVDHGEDINAYRYQQRPDYYSSYIGFESAFVELKNLEPATRYFFVIQNSFGKTQRYYVDTLPDDNNERISIISGGDSRNNRVPRQNANKLVAKLKPHFVYFGGDMTNLGTTTEWRMWFEDWQLTIDEDGRVTPIVAARGNHEYGNDILKVLFWLPQWNYYSFNVANKLIHVVTLNSEMAAGGTQLKWLEQDLAENRDARWTIAQYHKPMRPHVKSKAEGGDEYKSWAQLFYDEDVDIVFESDSHTVKSTWPLRPSTEDGSYEGFIRDDENGTVYVGEGCWGAPIRSANDVKPWTRESGKFNQFKWSFFDQDKIEVRTVKVDNADEVESLSLDRRFDMPLGIDLWETDYGKVIEIR
jgi:hypothetical protein